MTYLILFFALFFSATSSSQSLPAEAVDEAQTAATTRIYIQDSQPLQLLDGVNLLNGSNVTFSCVEGKRVVAENGRFEVKSTLQILDDFEEVKDLIGVDLVAQVNGIANSFEIASGYQFIHDSKISRYSLFMAIVQEVSGEGSQVEDVSLKQKDPWNNPITLPKKGDVESQDNFRQMCGDGFVHSVVHGARYFGIVRVNSVSQARLNDFKAKLQQAMTKGKPSDSVNVQVQGVFEEFQASLSAVYYQYQLGGDVMPVPTSVGELFSNSERFAESIDQDNAMPMIAYVESYQPLFGGTEYQTYDYLPAKTVINNAVEAYDETRDRFADVEYVIHHIAEFSTAEIGLGTLQQYKLEVIKQLDALAQFISGCSKEPTVESHCTLPDLALLDNPLPPRKDNICDGYFLEADKKPCPVSSYQTRECMACNECWHGWSIRSKKKVHLLCERPSAYQVCRDKSFGIDYQLCTQEVNRISAEVLQRDAIQ